MGGKLVKAIAVVAVLTVAALGSAAPAVAKKKHKYKSEVTIALDEAASHGQILTFFGTVSSKKGKCVADREVDIVFRDPRTGLTSLRGHVNADASGNWRIEGVHGNAGEFFAVVDKFSYKPKRVCKGAQASVQFP